jgi:integrase
MAHGTILTKVTKDGTKRYKTIILINGKQQWRTWDKKRDAENYLDELSPEVRDRIYREIKKATFKEYVEHWQATHLTPEKFKPLTYGGYRSIVEHHPLPEFKDYPMQAISATEINAFAAKLLQKPANRCNYPASAKTVRNILTLLGKIFSKAVSENYLKISPMAGIEQPKINKEQKGRALKPDEIQSILKACDEDMHTMIAAAITTGMRRGEQFALDWEDIDFDNDIIRVRRSLFWKFGKYHEKKDGNPNYTFIPPKPAKSSRDIDMSPELRRELRELYMRSGKKGLVFCTPKGTPLSPDNIAKRSFTNVTKKPKPIAQRTTYQPSAKCVGMTFVMFRV